MKIENRTAVITGSSSGIGRAIALSFAAAGANVIVHANRSVEQAEAVARQISSLNREATVICADLADLAEQDRFCKQAWQWKQGIDIVVNNAGADVLTGEAANWSFEKKLEQLWRVDVLATMRLSRWFGAKMKEVANPEFQPVILNLGWDQADFGMAGESGEMFGAIKSAVMGFSRSLSRSLAPAVRVNCLAPGWIQTSWGSGASEYWQSRARQECLLDRWGTPEDVANVATFLASDQGSFINGQVFPINGGFNSSPSQRETSE